MDQTQPTLLAAIAKELQLPAENIQTAVELLDEGNTIPFIARFRKDKTGNLDARQLRDIRQLLVKRRGLGERKNYILKSIDSQGKLSDELRQKIEQASTSKDLEDLFLPFKPKKQSLATVARQKGLEPLARDILEGVSPEIDLATRSTDFVRVDKDLNSIDEVIDGVSHIIAERFSERVELRSRLRKIIWDTGKIVTTKVESESKTTSAKLPQTSDGKSKPDSAKTRSEKTTAAKPESIEVASAAATDAAEPDGKAEPPTGSPVVDSASGDAGSASGDAGTAESAASSTPTAPPQAEVSQAEVLQGEVSQGEVSQAEVSQAEVPVASEKPEAVASEPEVDPPTGPPSSEELKSEKIPEAPSEMPKQENGSPESHSGTDSSAPVPENPATAPAASEPAALKKTGAANPPSPQTKPKKPKKKKKKSKEDTQFQDYFNFSEELRKLPPHRVLAINRGERAKKIKVRLERNAELIKQTVNELLVPAGHPFENFLEKCAHDALNRLIVPALEREIRRELTENAEQHALQVFERNLRMLLLQPPVHANSLLAIDPGYRSGCQVAILDKFGQFKTNDRFHIVGNQQKQAEGKQLLVKLIEDHKVDLIAIGNGTGCRATEQIVSDIIKEHFADSNLRFVIVNEAGTSVYSTSEIGREELPQCEPVVRSAVSIGRRLLDPLSELVKVNPANLGVGLYQHDVKAKHLGQALDEAVESCVNYVGVDVNTASTSLLKFISGLGQLTARRVVEYRQENGPFKNRQEIKKVTGFGDATFVQSAGFLRVYGGDQLLDGSSLHPESYELVSKILEKTGFSVDDLPIRRTATVVPEPPGVAQPAAAKNQAPVATLTAVHVEQANPADPAKQAGTADQILPAAEVAPLQDATGTLAESDSNAVTATADASSAETPTAETPTAETPTAETPTAETPTAETPTAETPTAETPTAETPTAETPTAETPTAGVGGGENRVNPEIATAAAEIAAVAGEVSDTGSTPASETGSAPPSGDASIEQVSVSNDLPMADSSEDPAGHRLDPVVAARNRELREKLKSLNTGQLSSEFGVGELLIKDIIHALMRPGRDPRFDLPKPIFRRGIIKLEDLKSGMQLKAQVLNVVDFGVFVDIGLGESSLIHISQLSRKFVRDPYRFFSVGDILNVWVNEIDIDRRRVSLTAIRPESARQAKPRARTSHKERGQRTRRTDKPQSRRRDTTVRKERPKRKKSPPKPLTQGMAEGKEAMRSFSDLAQFYKLKDDKEEES